MRSSYIAELAADAAEIVSDWGRQVVFKARTEYGETSGTTLAVSAMIGDPMLSQELVPGGVEDVMTFEVRVLASSTLPASWRPLSDREAWMGRKVVVQGYGSDLRVVETTNKEGLPWVSFKVVSANK
jgi:hypothetical protein